jgi:hypothetical protein
MSPIHVANYKWLIAGFFVVREHNNLGDFLIYSIYSSSRKYGYRPLSTKPTWGPTRKVQWDLFSCSLSWTDLFHVKEGQRFIMSLGVTLGMRDLPREWFWKKKKKKKKKVSKKKKNEFVWQRIWKLILQYPALYYISVMNQISLIGNILNPGLSYSSPPFYKLNYIAPLSFYHYT